MVLSLSREVPASPNDRGSFSRPAVRGGANGVTLDWFSAIQSLLAWPSVRLRPVPNSSMSLGCDARKQEGRRCQVRKA